MVVLIINYPKPFSILIMIETTYVARSKALGWSLQYMDSQLHCTLDWTLN